MADATAEEAAQIRAMSDEDLLAQLNGFDPYDVEFRRRFLALKAKHERLRRNLTAISETAEANGYGANYIICHSCVDIHDVSTVALQKDRTDD